MMLLRTCITLLILVALAGCGGPRAVLGLPVSATGTQPSALVPIYVATTRARSDNLSLPYSAQRSRTLNFAKFEIGIPQNHVRGRVEKTGRVPDPRWHFSARSYQPLADRRELIRQLNTSLAQRAPENREICDRPPLRSASAWPSPARSSCSRGCSAESPPSPCRAA